MTTITRNVTTIVRHDLALTGAAEFSTCERYRYCLRRSFYGASVLAPAKHPIVFLMLNPSTADALKNDRTVAKCCLWAREWGYSDLLVANLFALRSTDPNALLREPDPIGPENDATLASIPAHATIVAAWGNHRATRDRWQRVVELVGRPMLCLGVCADGMPRHPLYLKNDSRARDWTPPGYRTSAECAR